MVSGIQRNTRSEVLDQLADQIATIQPDPFIRVGVDGFDGAGKTTFATELGEVLSARGMTVVRAGIDNFHNSRAIRYARGKDSPEGFYRDSFDLAALTTNLLEPLGPNGSGSYRVTAFDLVIDAPKLSELEQAVPGTVLVFDGVFLHRPELANRWSWSVWLDVDFDVSVPRWRAREGGGPTDPSAEKNARYVDGQRLYLAEANPRKRATRVIDNNDFSNPRITDRLID